MDYWGLSDEKDRAKEDHVMKIPLRDVDEAFRVRWFKTEKAMARQETPARTRVTQKVTHLKTPAHTKMHKVLGY
jgi:hypothetical protein